MRITMRPGIHVLAFCIGFIAPISLLKGYVRESDLDEKVMIFLESNGHRGRDANVSASDGRALYDLIIKHDYKQALEIGTSPGNSAIWIAWALSKTGGKLTTIEINERRYRQALENFQEAGLSGYIDIRLADAHELVPELEGPYDFIFVDADKDWYLRYFRMLLPKLIVGGCFTAHNVLDRSMRGTSEFLEELKNTSGIETEIVRSSRSGLSVSFKRENHSSSGHRIIRPHPEAVLCGSL